MSTPSEPYAPTPVDTAQLETICRLLLVAIGEDPDREGLRDTPARWARWWQEFIEGNGTVEATTFEAAGSEMVVVSGMHVWSLCEHHLLPFQCQVAVGYLARDRILGLSKFGRLARMAAAALQTQEELVSVLATQVEAAADTEDVAVLARGQHTCMAMRGVRMPAWMTTSVMRGAFRDNATTRDEFMRLAMAPPPTL